MNSLLSSALREAFQNNFPFVLYRLPDSEQISIVIQKSEKLDFMPFENIDQQSGFFIAPFRGEKINELICLKPDQHIQIPFSGKGLMEMVNSFEQVDSDVEEDVCTLTKAEYLERVNYLVEILKEGDLRKIVLSRVVEHSLPSDFNSAAFFQNLLQIHPKAFVYYATLPGFGNWIGATPETLLSLEVDHAETVALAGTQPADKFKWTEKEIKEQQIVMDYIEESLFKNEITDYGRTGPFTIKAGNVAHLKTKYNLSLDQIKGKVGKLITDLHPTPAVCGLPRTKSYELIRKVEKHDRGLYTGFLGPWNLNGESRLFVNLRCARLSGEKILLYVGGGLTAESSPEAEWEETIRKSQTLLSVLEKM